MSCQKCVIGKKEECECEERKVKSEKEREQEKEPERKKKGPFQKTGSEDRSERVS